MQEKRKKWGTNISGIKAENLVFLDESGVNINLTRLYAHAPKNKRAVDSAPLNKPVTTTVLSSIRLDGTIVYQPLYQIKHVLPSKHWKLKVSNDESSFWKCKCILARKS